MVALFGVNIILYLICAASLFHSIILAIEVWLIIVYFTALMVLLILAGIRSARQSPPSETLIKPSSSSLSSKLAVICPCESVELAIWTLRDIDNNLNFNGETRYYAVISDESITLPEGKSYIPYCGAQRSVVYTHTLSVDRIEEEFMIIIPPRTRLVGVGSAIQKLQKEGVRYTSTLLESISVGTLNSPAHVERVHPLVAIRAINTIYNGAIVPALRWVAIELALKNLIIFPGLESIFGTVFATEVGTLYHTATLRKFQFDSVKNPGVDLTLRLLGAGVRVGFDSQFQIMTRSVESIKEIWAERLESVVGWFGAFPSNLSWIVRSQEIATREKVGLIGVYSLSMSYVFFYMFSFMLFVVYIIRWSGVLISLERETSDWKVVVWLVVYFLGAMPILFAILWNRLSSINRAISKSWFFSWILFSWVEYLITMSQLGVYGIISTII